MSRAVVALGANLGDPRVSFSHAARAFGLLPGTKIVRLSNLYRTAPVGFSEQPDFLNAAVLLETALSPQALLGACLGIEAALGRLRTCSNGPRVLDLDLLLYEGAVLDTRELTLPHPRMRERTFVLVPLADLFPDGRAPGFSFAVPQKREIDAAGAHFLGKWGME